MAFTIQCGSCNKQFDAGQDGGIVHCPHCDTALQLPERPADPQNVPVAPESTIQKASDAPQPGEGAKAKPGSGVLSDIDPSDLPVTADSGEWPIESQFAGLPGEGTVSDVGMPAIDTGSGAKIAGPDSAAALSQFAATLGDDPPPDPDEPTAMDLQEDLNQIVPKLQSATDDDNTKAAASKPAPKEKPKSAAQPATTSAAAAEAPAGVSRTVFFAVCGYAGAVTIAFILLYFSRKGGQLDALPDVPPAKEGYIVPENTQMPPGHSLKIGQTQRYGNLEITPMRVTRGKAKFAEFSDDGEDGSPVVLKLWLKIKNVSKNQSFRPFGRDLVYGNTEKESGSRIQRANIFVCQSDEKKKDGRLVFVYFNPDPRDRFKGQQIDRELGPGDEYETFIASNDEGLEKLKGDLIWRVHVRKGYNPKSKNGVTTIFEVTFHSDEIQTGG